MRTLHAPLPLLLMLTALAVTACGKTDTPNGAAGGQAAAASPQCGPSDATEGAKEISAKDAIALTEGKTMKLTRAVIFSDTTRANHGKKAFRVSAKIDGEKIAPTLECYTGSNDRTVLTFKWKVLSSVSFQEEGMLIGSYGNLVFEVDHEGAFKGDAAPINQAFDSLVVRGQDMTKERGITLYAFEDGTILLAQEKHEKTSDEESTDRGYYYFK